MNKNILFILLLLCSAFSTHSQNSSIITFSTPEHDQPGPVSCDTEGNVYIIIHSAKISKLVKLNPSGQTVWTMQDSFWHPSGIRTYGNDLFVTGGFRSGWETANGVMQSRGMLDIFIARYSLSGEELWIRTAGGINDESGRFVDISKNGHVFVSGTFNGNITIGNTPINHLGEDDMFLTCFDTDGNSLWAKGIAGYLADELYNMVWLEEKERLLLNVYFQLSTNLGNGIITSDNSFVTAAYDEGGTAQALLQGTGNMRLLAVDTATKSIYMHSGIHYYDTTGMLYSYSYELEEQFSLKVRKGTKSILFKDQRAYIFGSSPTIVNSIVRQQGYIDCFDESWTMVSQKTFGIQASMHSGCFSSAFWFSGSFTDTADLYGHRIATAAKDQDVFLMKLDERVLNIRISRQACPLSLFPNPANGYIMLIGLAGNTALSVYDTDGRIVIPEFVNHVDYIDISGLSPGVYYLKSGDYAALKFIKA